MSISSSGGKLHEAMFLVNEWTSEQKGAWLSPFGDQFWSLEEPTDGQTEMRVKGLGLPTSWWRVPHMWSKHIPLSKGTQSREHCVCVCICRKILRKKQKIKRNSIPMPVACEWSLSPLISFCASLFCAFPSLLNALCSKCYNEPSGLDGSHL